MAVDNQNFVLHVGEAKNLLFTVTDNAGAIVDLTGTTAVFRLSSHPLSVPVLEKELAVVEASPPAGEFIIELEGAETAALSHGVYHYQALIVDTASPINITVVATGWVDMRPSLADI